MIHIEHIHKSFGTHTALHDVSLHIRRGSIFGLLGPNGAGKTTLIRILNRLHNADSGSVTIDGLPLSEDTMPLIGYLPEERGLYPKMRIDEQAVYLARLKGLKRQEAERRLDWWLQHLDIEEWRHKRPSQLSKGMQQKVQFVITTLHEPPLLILDEPFSGLDPVNADVLKREVIRLRDEGTTILLSSHDMGSVEELCDDIAILSHGNLLLSGALHDIRDLHPGLSMNDIFIHTVNER